jgi:hypothetical protein
MQNFILGHPDCKSRGEKRQGPFPDRPCAHSAFCWEVRLFCLYANVQRSEAWGEFDRGVDSGQGSSAHDNNSRHSCVVIFVKAYWRPTDEEGAHSGIVPPVALCAPVFPEVIHFKTDPEFTRRRISEVSIGFGGYSSKDSIPDVRRCQTLESLADIMIQYSLIASNLHRII